MAGFHRAAGETWNGSTSDLVEQFQNGMNLSANLAARQLKTAQDDLERARRVRIYRQQIRGEGRLNFFSKDLASEEWIPNEELDWEDHQFADEDLEAIREYAEKRTHKFCA